ncbi:arylsulfatase [Actinocorallia herbida]|uniref:arylsulfatase n=1 Tax=Actinocorallia herbida TaxID=58109 RepID=UPI001476CB80|nr:arylsulfatase [Actinocorallia herbida]
MPKAAVKRRHLLLGGAAVASGAAALALWPRHPAESAAPRPSQAAVRRPNFIVILADDVGWGEIGAYGQRKITTPRIDRMAAEGLMFTQAYASSPVCAPDRASLFTGLHSGHTAVRRNPPRHGDLPLGADPTFASVLTGLGYRTGLFGKWGFGPESDGPDHPLSHGFTDFFGYLTHHAAHDYYPARLWDGRRSVPLDGNEGDEGDLYGPDVIMDRAMGFLRDAASSPFLLMLTPTLPHAPSTIPDLGAYADKEWSGPDKAHAAQVSLLDTYAGRVIDTVAELGLADDTVIVFTSDNGPHEEKGVDPDFFAAAGPFRGYKRSLYEGGIRIPFVAWSPRLLAATAGQRSTASIAHYDLLPTLADLAGAPVPPGLDGMSMRPALTGQGALPERPYLYWARVHAGSTRRQRALEHGRGRDAAAAVRFGRWKAIGFAPAENYTPPGPGWRYELYDLDTDPSESHDVSGRYPELVRRAKGYMRESWR